MYKSLLAVATVLLFTFGPSAANADVVFAFQANSVENKPLFVMDNDSLDASNTLDLTVDVNGNPMLYSGAMFEFHADLTGITSIPFVGNFYALDNIEFEFRTMSGDLIVSAVFGPLNFFQADSDSSASFFGASTNGDIYTQGVALNAFLADIGLAGQLLDNNQDFSFTLAGIVFQVGGPGQPGGSLTAEASYTGTSELVVPLPAAGFAGLTLLGLVRARRNRKA